MKMSKYSIGDHVKSKVKSVGCAPEGEFCMVTRVMIGYSKTGINLYEVITKDGLVYRNFEDELEPYELPSFLSEEQKQSILEAKKEGKPIIVSGIQGSTGKTTLINFLNEMGMVAFEKWECLEIELNSKII